MQEVFSLGEMLEAQKRMFISLLPKRQDATKPSHYMLISLCMILYKIYTKLTVEMMKSILPRLIYPKQKAFIGKHSISNNVLLVQEFMYEIHYALIHNNLGGQIKHEKSLQLYELAVLKGGSGFWFSQIVDQLDFDMYLQPNLFYLGQQDS